MDLRNKKIEEGHLNIRKLEERREVETSLTSSLQSSAFVLEDDIFILSTQQISSTISTWIGFLWDRFSSLFSHTLLVFQNFRITLLLSLDFLETKEFLTESIAGAKNKRRELGR